MRQRSVQHNQQRDNVTLQNILTGVRLKEKHNIQSKTGTSKRNGGKKKLIKVQGA